MAPARPAATLLVDGLLGGSAAGGAELPALSAPGLDLLLTRGERLPPGPSSQEAALFGAFGLSTNALQWGGDLPVAALTFLADTGEQPDGWWMRADPVCLRPATDELVLVEPGALALSQEEAHTLCDSIVAHFQEQHWQLLSPATERWYLQPATPPSLVTRPLPELIARPISGALPQGEDGSTWRRILNEIQMLLFEHPVNVARESRGAPPVNSLWLWGGGQCPEVPHASGLRAWGDDVLVRGLALAANVGCDPLPEDAPAWFACGAASGDRHLIVLDGLRNAASYRDGEAWWAAVQGLDRAWIEPLVTAVGRGQLAGIEVDDPRGGRYQIDRRGLRRWWRRPRPFVQVHGAT